MMIYHWWASEGDRCPHLNLRSPLIHSIATLRTVNQNIKVFVLDCSSQDYHGWDKRLDFTVVPWQCSLREYRHRPGWQNLSRLFDLHEFCKSGVWIYSDLDVFWLKDPLPLHQDPSKFCFNKYNSGFFYFDASSAQRFFELFKAYVLTALNDDNFRVITRAYSEYQNVYYVLDEAILTYMAVKMPDLFNIIDIYEHMTPTIIHDTASANHSAIKMIHCNSLIVENKLETEEWRQKHNRGLVPLLIKEIYEKLDKDIIKELYAKELGQFKQVSIADKEFIKRLLGTRKNGMYNLINSLL